MYIRKCDLNDVLVDVKYDDIPESLHTLLAAEQTADNQRKKEKSEAHLYATVNVRKELLSNYKQIRS